MRTNRRPIAIMRRSCSDSPLPRESIGWSFRKRQALPVKVGEAALLSSVYSQIAIVRQSLADVHLLFDVDASVVLVGRDLDRGLQELRAPLEGPARDVV